MTEQTVIDPESAVIGIKLGAALVRLKVIHNKALAGEYSGMCNLAHEASVDIRDVLEILGVDIT